MSSGMGEPERRGDYLYEPSVPWLKEVRGEVIDPLRAHALGHPFLEEASRGSLPRAKIRKMLEDTLWIIVGFPQIIAGLASRCPRYDHATKTQLLKNAYEECEHPPLLARAVRALGGAADTILAGPEYAYRPLPSAWTGRAWQEWCVFHRPWVVGMSAVCVGVESIVPTIFDVLGRVLAEKYGVSYDDLEWFRIHGGAVEEGHGNEGLLLLERYVHSDDRETQAACRDAIERSARSLVGTLDTYYAYTE